MTDSRLRELERRWKETAAAEDEAAFFRERWRTGDLPGSLEQIYDAISDADRYAQLSLGRAEGGGEDVPAQIDRFVVGLGLRSLEGRWREHPRARAERILTRLLWRDMAYQAEEMPLVKAEELAARLLALFTGQARFFSNSDWRSDDSRGWPRMSGWNPVTKATFDSGLVVWDGISIGLLWFEDED